MMQALDSVFAIKYLRRLELTCWRWAVKRLRTETLPKCIPCSASRPSCPSQSHSTISTQTLKSEFNSQTQRSITRLKISRCKRSPSWIHKSRKLSQESRALKRRSELESQFQKARAEMKRKKKPKSRKSLLSRYWSSKTILIPRWSLSLKLTPSANQWLF